MSLRLRSVPLLAAFAAFPIAALPAPPAAHAAIAPARIAIINAQKAVADTEEIKQAQAALQAKYGPRQQEIANLQQQVQNLQNQLDGGNLTPQKNEQVRQQLYDAQKDLQRKEQDLQSDVNFDRQGILSSAGQKMTQVIQKIAQEHNIDVVIDTSNTLYYKPALDITAEATADYNKMYPPKSSK